LPITARHRWKGRNETLSELYQFKILTEGDWQQFKMLFDKVHPGYINGLRKKFPDLSPAEERQFLLIKLDIDNKECANMLGISAPSVKKNRYRLKKKFNLAEQDSLDDFVRNLVV
jgi:DNA-binding CsgD family transcriptional regulator